MMESMYARMISLLLSILINGNFVQIFSPFSTTIQNGESITLKATALLDARSEYYDYATYQYQWYSRSAEPVETITNWTINNEDCRFASDQFEVGENGACVRIGVEMLKKADFASRVVVFDIYQQEQVDLTIESNAAEGVYYLCSNLPEGSYHVVFGLHYDYYDRQGVTLSEYMKPINVELYNYEEIPGATNETLTISPTINSDFYRSGAVFYYECKVVHSEFSQRVLWTRCTNKAVELTIADELSDLEPTQEPSDPETTEDVTTWVTDDGTACTKITKNGMIYLKEESGVTSAWYAIDNSEGIFEIGSVFHVKWLSKADDADKFDEYYSILDDTYKNKSDVDKMYIFLTGVTKLDGVEYTDFGGKILPYYIQIGEDWDKDDINAVFISKGEDEVVDVTYIENTEYPEGKGLFAKLSLKHFSPYAIFDELDELSLLTQNSSTDISNPPTGDNIKQMVTLLIISIFGFAAVFAVEFNSYRKEENN